MSNFAQLIVQYSKHEIIILFCLSFNTGMAQGLVYSVGGRTNEGGRSVIAEDAETTKTASTGMRAKFK